MYLLCGPFRHSPDDYNRWNCTTQMVNTKNPAAVALGRYRQVCPARGCLKESVSRGYVDGLVKVCKYCQRCVNHCQHEAFEPATSRDQIDAELETTEDAE
jgi:hypothetical protein